MPHLLITGASGYIGGRLVRALAEHTDAVLHCPIRAMSRRDHLEALGERVVLHTMDGNYESLEAVFRAHPVDAVFHLAAMAQYDAPPEAIPALVGANIIFGTQLLAAMTAHGCTRFLNTGTYWQHDDAADYHPMCLYASTKQAFESVIDHYVMNHGLAAATLKLYDVYGPGDPRGKLFGLLARAWRNPELQPLAMTPGEQCVNLIHVDDVARAFHCAWEHLQDGTIAPGHHPRHWVGNAALPLREIVRTYADITGREVRIDWGALPYRKGQIMHPYEGPPIPGWQADVTLEAGIRGLLKAGE